MLIPAPSPGPHRCAVLGSPIGHSRSPLLHRAAYDSLGLDWSYDAVEVTEDSLRGFLDGLEESWRGLSLTMPLKRAVMPLLDEVSDMAVRAGAANTVVLAGGRRYGANTDVPGAAAALRERYDGPVDRAVVVGGGATAASLLLALADLGCSEAVLVVRSPARAAETLEAVRRHPSPPRVDVKVLGEELELDRADVVASTVPATVQEPVLLESLLELAPGVVFEVVYDPWPTPLMTATKDAGTLLVHGLDLLTHQAALQFELMTGSSVDVDVLRAVIR